MTTAISPATPSDFDDIRELMIEYSDTFDVRERCYQDLDAELAGLPGAYAPPEGALLIARSDDGAAVGQVGLWRLDDGICEMKRLYVRPAGQGTGLGRRLVEAVIAEGRRLGYRAMRLDTLPDMKTAQGLYASLGFKPTARYNKNPVPDVIYLELAL
jgi:ribosomal protein S18 acetylase RimI-like enzyme